MRDEDNSTLLEYFINNIYKPKDKYMLESINATIVERDEALKRLEDNIKSFDSKGFFMKFNEHYDPPCPVGMLKTSDFDGDFLDTLINGYLLEMVIGHNTLIRWKMVNNKIYITGKVSVVDHKTKIEYYIIKGSNIISIYIC